MKDKKTIWHEPTEKPEKYTNISVKTNIPETPVAYGESIVFNSDVKDKEVEYWQVGRYLFKLKEITEWSKIDDLLELSEEKGNATQYKRIAQMLNDNLKLLIEKCSMYKDMDWVEQYKVATDMADKALKEIDSIKGE